MLLAIETLKIVKISSSGISLQYQGTWCLLVLFVVTLIPREFLLPLANIQLLYLFGKENRLIVAENINIIIVSMQITKNKVAGIHYTLKDN